MLVTILETAANLQHCGWWKEKKNVRSEDEKKKRIKVLQSPENQLKRCFRCKEGAEIPPQQRMMKSCRKRLLQVTVPKGYSTSYWIMEWIFHRTLQRPVKTFSFTPSNKSVLQSGGCFHILLVFFLELLSYFPVPTPIFSIQSIFQTLKQFGLYTRRYRISEFLIVWLLFKPVMLSSGQWTQWTPTLVIRSISLTRSAASDTVSAHKNGNLFFLCLAFSLLNNNPYRKCRNIYLLLTYSCFILKLMFICKVISKLLHLLWGINSK